MTPGNLRSPSPLWLGVAGLVVGVAYVLRIMVPHDMDPTIMLAFGEDSPVQSTYARALIGNISVRESFGHDGQVFFIQANDPWFLHPELHAVIMDRPVYRGQRMAYPTIASGFGLFSPGVVIWTLPILNVLALGAGSYVAAVLARHLGGSTWLGLAFCLNPGILAEVDISGGGALALAFFVWGVLAAERGHFGVAATALAGASLSRETMLASVAVIAWILWRRHVRAWWVVIATPVAAVAVWGAYVRVTLSGMPYTGPSAFSRYPLEGPIGAFQFWRTEPLNMLMIGAFMAVCLAFTVRTFRSRHLLAWAASPTLVIASVASLAVWRFPYDIARVLAPVFLAYPVLAFISQRSPVKSLQPSFEATR